MERKDCWLLSILIKDSIKNIWYLVMILVHLQLWIVFWLHIDGNLRIFQVNLELFQLLKKIRLKLLLLERKKLFLKWEQLLHRLLILICKGYIMLVILLGNVLQILETILRLIALSKILVRKQQLLVR